MCSCRVISNSDGAAVGPGEPCGLPFPEYTADSLALKDICHDQGCCPYVNAQERFIPAFIDQHVSDQAHCVFLPGGESLVDFIGSTENIEDDWDQVPASLPLKVHTLIKPILRREFEELQNCFRVFIWYLIQTWV
jgi:hypothetical protein